MAGVRAVTGSAFGAGVAGVIEPVSSLPDWSRFGARRTFYVALKHLSDGAGLYSLPDRIAALDWRNRVVRVTMLRVAVDGGEYKAPHEVAEAGSSVSEDSGLQFTGTSGGSLWTSARGFLFTMTSGGVLQMSKAGGTAPDDVTHGDGWLLVIVASDRLI